MIAQYSKYFRADGSPVGITFSRAIPGNHGNCVCARGVRGAKDTNFGVDNDDFAAVYARAVDRRLENLGMFSDDALRAAMLDARAQFLDHYGLTIAPVTIYRLVSVADSV